MGPGPDGVLLARVAAAPVDGAANRALVRLLAETLSVPPGAVTLVAGATGRRKRLLVEGLDRADILARWPGLAI